MRTFADPSFYRVFDTLISNAGTTPGTFKTQWSDHGVDFDRSRHSCTADGYSFTVEICQLEKTGTRPWALIAVKEYWHLERAAGLPRQVRWAKLITGRRTDALDWFKQRGAEIEQQWAQASDRLHPNDRAGLADG